jgi:hypothetical protein
VPLALCRRVADAVVTSNVKPARFLEFTADHLIDSVDILPKVKLSITADTLYTPQPPPRG